MSKRPSATNNDPGYLYNQKRLLQIFAVSSLFLGAMITWMIWDDFDRPWKDEQRAQFLWEAERMRLEMGILDQRTQELRAKLGAAEERGQAEIDRLESDLLGISDELATARGTYTGALMNYNAQRQFTSEASFNSGNARTPDERDTWKLRHKEEVDKEARLYANLQSATDNMDRLVDAEKEILGAIARQTDEAIRKSSESELENEDAEDQGPEAIARRVAMRRKELSRIQLLERGIEQKQGYNFLREIPLTDFLAPPTKVEQVVLDYVTDDYTFAAPKKVDRCGTCHIATIQPGFEHARFPVEIFDMPAGPAKIKMFEEGVYRFVNGIIDGVWPAVSKTSKFPHEEGQLRDLEVHHETLRILFVEYDSEEGVIGLDKKDRKKWRKWKRNEDGTWVMTPDGVSIAQLYLELLDKLKDKAYWRTHSHFDFMVGSQSPHPYGRFGCTVCHSGRGWSTDFGYAWHTPPLEEIKDWMTDEWAKGLEGYHLPNLRPIVDGKPLTLSGAMEMGNPEGDDPFIGLVRNDAVAKRWKEELGWTKVSLKYWMHPQLPKSLVQSSCLKCHKEGLYYPPEPEYPNAHLGPPVPGLPDVYEYENHAEAHIDPEVDQLFIPKEKPAYKPERLLRGMENFLSFGCWGCHKVDEEKYPFMKSVRSKRGPNLDTIATKTSKEFLLKWVYNPSSYRPLTQMPRFWELSNNSHDFEFRFADSGFEKVDGVAWGEQEAYAIVEYIFEESRKRAPTYPVVDLTKGDAGRGERIVVGFDKAGNQAKACIACHTIPIRSPELAVDYEKMKKWSDPLTKETYGWSERMARRHGPDLAGIGSKVDPLWLAAWLKNPHAVWGETNMPNLRLTPKEILDVVAYLMTLRNEAFDKAAPIAKNAGIMKKIAYELKVSERALPTNRQALNLIDRLSERDRALYVGKKLVKHYGCFGCHNIDDYKDTKPIGTELSQWGSKLVERLEFKHAPIDFHKKDWPYARFMFAYAKLTNPRIFDFGDPRADLPYDRLKMPRFGFSNPGEVRDIATFLIGLVDDVEVKAIEFKPDAREAEIIAGRRLVRSKNCQACHIIEGEGGDVWPAISERKWQPPDLRGQGLKTQPDWLFKFLQAPERLRPWHSINMPTFDLTDGQTRAIVKYFALLSEVPYPFEGALPDGLVGPDGKPVPFAKPKTLKLADPKDRTRKITRTARNALEEARYMFEEYQCESCHAPEAGVVPEGNRAPVFTLVRDGRLRPPWIRLWLYGPLMLQPGTAMPAFFTKGQPQDAQFFGGSAAAQIRALNDYLNYHYPTKKR